MCVHVQMGTHGGQRATWGVSRYYSLSDFFFFFFETVSHCSSVWSRTHYVAPASLELCTTCGESVDLPPVNLRHQTHVISRGTELTSVWASSTFVCQAILLAFNPVLTITVEPPISARADELYFLFNIHHDPCGLISLGNQPKVDSPLYFFPPKNIFSGFSSLSCWFRPVHSLFLLVFCHHLCEHMSLERPATLLS